MSEDGIEIRTHQVLGAPKRAELLDVLRRRSEPLSVADAARTVGLHLNTTRMHLDQLVAVGLVERLTQRPHGPGRPKSLYRAAVDRAAGFATAEADESFKSLASVLAAGLSAAPDPAAAAIDAGQRWVTALDATDLAEVTHPGTTNTAESAGDSLNTLMNRLGFDPELDLDHDRITLHRCPFAEVARDNRQVVCNVHLGMVQATLDRLGGPLHAVGIEPFVSDDPLVCHVHLSTSAQDDAIQGRKS